MKTKPLPRRVVLTAGLMLTSIVALSSSADAGGIFRRMFGGQCYQPQPRYVAPAPSTATSVAPQYQSFSHEPGASAAAPQVAPQPSGGASHYRGVYRVEPGSTVPNMFRADRKILGLQSN